MTLPATGVLGMDANIQYIFMLVHGESLRQFEFFSADVEDTETLNVDYYIKGLALYFSLWIRFFKRAMRRVMKKRTA